MIRKLALLSCFVAAFATTGIASAGASTTPPTGTLSCGATGTLTLKPALPGAGSPVTTKPTSAKVHNASASPCTTAVTGGKAPITGGVVILNAKLAPGQNCGTLLGGPVISKAVLVVKLTNTDGTTGKTETVAVVKPTNLQFSIAGVGIHITGTIPQTKAANKPFGGETFEAQINADNIGDLLNCASTGSTTPLSEVDFSAAGGSSISIHP